MGNSSLFFKKENLAVRRKAKPLFYVVVAFFVIIVVAVAALCTWNILKAPVDSKNTEEIQVTIPQGSGVSTIANILKEKKLIKNTTFFKIYVKINNVSSMKASTYPLKQSMSLEEIINILVEGNNYNPDAIKLTFKEGKRVTDYIGVIVGKTNNTQEETENIFKDQTYLKTLITNYWFLTDDILNTNIYYPLEGYLFPDTYYFANKDVDVKTIIETMLTEMDKKLTPYKQSIEASDLSIHEILTLASVIEKEGKTKDFKDISSVFHNRLQQGMQLQSCATSYYGMGLEFSDIGIATTEMMNNKNPYNTYIISGLPVGPISMPGLNSIDAALNPTETNNLFFISDNEGNTYFFATAAEQSRKKEELIKNGKWKR